MKKYLPFALLVLATGNAYATCENQQTISCSTAVDMLKEAWLENCEATCADADCACAMKTTARASAVWAPACSAAEASCAAESDCAATPWEGFCVSVGERQPPQGRQAAEPAGGQVIVVDEATTAEVAPAPTPLCDQSTASGKTYCWLQVSNRENCYAWIQSHSTRTDESIRLAGQCKNGRAHSEGNYAYADLTVNVNEQGAFVDGKRQGYWVERSEWEWGALSITEGTYQDGRKHGNWSTSRDGVKTAEYLYDNGRFVRLVGY